MRVDATLQRSVTDVVADSAAFQWGALVGGYLVLVAYGALSHAGAGRAGGAARSHAALGAWGIVVVSLATLLSFGAYGFLGIPSTGLAAGVVPFVSLGVGAVDMFVLSEAYVDAVRAAPAPAEAAARAAVAAAVVGEVLRGTGPSIAFTTLINLVASLVAAQMPIRVVEYFCYQVAVAVVANLLLLLVLFLPAVVLDCRRTLAAAAAAAAAADGGGGCCVRRGAVAACGAQGGGGGGAMARFAREVYAPWLLSPAVSVAVLAGFGALCGALAWRGFARTETGLAVSDFTSVGSYQRDFALALERDFTLYPAYLFVETRAASAPATQQVRTGVGAGRPSSAVLDPSPHRGIYVQCGDV